MKYIFAFFVLVLSTPVFAATQPCENYAKSAAIKTYIKKAGTIQGSDGPEYSSVRDESFNNPYIYIVTIYDRNEDEDYWEVDFEVKIKKSGNTCKVIYVQEIASRN